MRIYVPSNGGLKFLTLRHCISHQHRTPTRISQHIRVHRSWTGLLSAPLMIDMRPPAQCNPVTLFLTPELPAPQPQPHHHHHHHHHHHYPILGLPTTILPCLILTTHTPPTEQTAHPQLILSCTLQLGNSCGVDASDGNLPRDRLTPTPSPHE